MSNHLVRLLRKSLTLLFGTMGVLSTGCEEPDGSGELQAVLEELRAVYEENSALKLEIGHLKEELHECTVGQLCQSVAGAFFSPHVQGSQIVAHCTRVLHSAPNPDGEPDSVLRETRQRVPSATPDSFSDSE